MRLLTHFMQPHLLGICTTLIINWRIYQGHWQNKLLCCLFVEWFRIKTQSTQHFVATFSLRLADTLWRSFCHSMSSKLLIKITAVINSPINYEVCPVIQLHYAKMVQPVDIHCEFCSAYNEHIISYTAVKKWCQLFGEEWTNFHNELLSNQPSIITDELDKKKINQKLMENRRFYIKELTVSFKYHGLLYKILTEKLNTIIARGIKNKSDHLFTILLY